MYVGLLARVCLAFMDSTPRISGLARSLARSTFRIMSLCLLTHCTLWIRQVGRQLPSLMASTATWRRAVIIGRYTKGGWSEERPSQNNVQASEWCNSIPPCSKHLRFLFPSRGADKSVPRSIGHAYKNCRVGEVDQPPGKWRQWDAGVCWVSWP